MAGGQAVTIDGYHLRLFPKSWWRQMSGDFWPYWQASKVSFRLHVTRKGEGVDEREISLFYVMPDGSSVNKTLRIPSLQKGKECDLPIKAVFIALTGDIFMVVDYELRFITTGFPGNYETLYVIHTTHKAWISLVVIAGVLAGLFGALFQYLLGLIIGND